MVNLLNKIGRRKHELGNDIHIAHAYKVSQNIVI